MKKCKLIIVLTSLTTAAIAMPASASGFFVGIGAGQSKVENGTSGGTYNGTPFALSGLNSSKTTLQLNGGYQFTDMWGVQVQYTYLGSRSGTISSGGFSGSTGDAIAYQYGIAGTGTFDVGSKVFLRGKLGVSSNHTDDITATVNGTPISFGGTSKTDVMAGIGVGYNWSENYSTRLEYEYFGKFESNNGTTSAKGTNLGLRMQYIF